MVVLDISSAAQANLDFDNDDDERVLLLVHDTRPPFLDGHISFSRQARTWCYCGTGSGPQSVLVLLLAKAVNTCQAMLPTTYQIAEHNSPEAPCACIAVALLSVVQGCDYAPSTVHVLQ